VKKQQSINSFWFQLTVKIISVLPAVEKTSSAPLKLRPYGAIQICLLLLLLLDDMLVARMDSTRFAHCVSLGHASSFL